jgi:integrase/recombinase XerD
MSQAKVLTEKELKRVLKVIDSKRHSSRNRCMFLMTHLCGTRIKETCAIRIQDAINSDGSIKSEIRLTSEQTKGSRGRVVYVSEAMQKEIELYLKTRFKLQNLQAVTYTDTSRALFPNQKNPNRGFSANTAAQAVNSWYKEAKVEGSSHSGRRGFITNLANKGVQVRLLQELAGHSSLSVTQKYIQTTPQLLHKAIALL